MFLDDPFVEKSLRPVELGFFWEMVDEELGPPVASFFYLMSEDSVTDSNGILNVRGLDLTLVE